MQYTYPDIFSTAQNSVGTHQFWCFLVLLPFFISPVPHPQNVSFWGLFQAKGKERVAGDKIGWTRRVRHGGHAVFSQKLLNTQSGVDRWACKSLIMKWANALKESRNVYKGPMGMDNRVGIDCGSGGGWGRGEQWGKNWDNYNWTIHFFKKIFKRIHWKKMQPLTTPVSTLIHMSSYNTHQWGESCTTRGQPTKRKFPPHTICQSHEWPHLHFTKTIAGRYYYHL